MAETRPLVTIAICTYNRAGTYLPLALESALGQTFPNLDVVVSDNCSTDDTEQVVGAVSDPRVRYFRQDRNIGAINNYNFCLAQARGGYFMLLHDDDLIDSDFIATCIDAAEGREAPIGLIRTGVRRIDGRGRPIRDCRNQTAGLDPEAFFRAMFAGGQPTYLCSTVFNTVLLRQLGGFDPKGRHFCDVGVESRLASRYERVDIEEPRASVRIHGSKLSATGSVRDWCVDSRWLMDVILDEMTGDRAPDRSFRKAGMHFFGRHCMNYARGVPGRWDRWRAYYTVYRSFGYANSFFFETFVARPTRSLAWKSARRLKARLT
jgi:glycosyltransferase involved in cell wall biosynthesis